MVIASFEFVKTYVPIFLMDVFHPNSRAKMGADGVRSSIYLSPALPLQTCEDVSSIGIQRRKREHRQTEKEKVRSLCPLPQIDFCF
ncbi:hypothetical protein K1719_004466 [Acacia pycnantha]|nr:hypothetical protein K1719_004466 [Acacia pycnantha]